MKSISQFVRSNEATAEAVERGIERAAATSVYEGARLMLREGVPMHVAMRVLLHPRARRSQRSEPWNDVPFGHA